jgi:hypothetical protein
MAWTAAEPPDAAETASLTSSPSRHRKRPLGKARERCLRVVAESSILSAGPSTPVRLVRMFRQRGGRLAQPLLTKPADLIARSDRLVPRAPRSRRL